MRPAIAILVAGALAGAVVAPLAAPLPAAGGPTRFASAVEDLPLMAGLEETAAAPFETAQGRIVRVEAVGDVRADAVLAYYDATLPQLGWRREEGASATESDTRRAFTRAGERLTVRVDTEPGARARVAFLITPAVPAAVR